MYKRQNKDYNSSIDWYKKSTEEYKKFYGEMLMVQGETAAGNRWIKRWSRFKIIVFVISVICFLLLMEDVTGAYRTAWIDQTMIRLVQWMRSGFLTGFFKLMTNMVHPVVLFSVSMFLIHILKQRRYLVALFGNLVLTLLLNLAIKGNIMRVRPPEDFRLITETGYSFPSGHAMLAASFYGFLAFLLLQTKMKAKHRGFGIASCLLMVLLVGFSRIYLGVHYATDVVGGYLVSAIYLLAYTLVVGKYLNLDEKFFESQKKPEKNHLLSSFYYAFSGIVEGIKSERNMMIHYFALCMVVVFGITLKLSVTEWCICLILCAIVISLELMNTAIECVVDLVTEEYDQKAKKAKDMAAGAVLVAAAVAALIGGFIFLPKIIALFT